MASSVAPGAGRHSDVRVVGRVAELAAVEGWLRTAHGAGSRTLVLEGPAGIGKTVLWRAALDQAVADGWAVLSATAFEGETGLGHATLADLLRDVPGGLVDEGSIQTGLLELLRSEAAHAPLVIAVDDIQWLEQQSADALAFVARRLRDDNVCFLHTRRGDAPAAAESSLRDRTTSLWLPPLDELHTQDLVRERVGGLTQAARFELVAASAGNPLFALELGRLLRQRGGRRITVPATIGALLQSRLEGVPAPARRALLAVALSPAIRRAELETAVGSSAVDEAVTAGVLESRGDSISATHPLLGTAARDAATAEERRVLHLALADAVTEDAPHWLHVAQSAEEPDEDIAAGLAAASRRSTARGHRRPALELAEHALRLTSQGGVRHDERLLAVATCCRRAGETERALEVLGDVSALSTPALRAEASLLLIDIDPVPLPRLQEHLDRADADSAEAGVPALRALVLVDRAGFATRGWLDRIDEVEAWAEEAMELAGDDIDVRRRALFELAWARAERSSTVADLLELEQRLPDPPALFSYAVERADLVSRLWRGELDQARAGFTRMLTAAGDRGEAESVSVALMQLAEIDLRAGHWAQVDDWLAQLEDEGSFQDFDPGILRLRAQVAAGRGQPELAREAAARASEMAAAQGMRWQAFEARRADGLAALLVGDPASAVEALRPVWEHLSKGGFVDPGAFPVAPDLAQALVAVGQPADAEPIAASLAALPDHPWAATALHQVRGHLAVAARDNATGGAEFAAAASGLGTLGFRFDRARCLAHAGLAARRDRRARAAKELLGEAVAEFEALDSTGWRDWAARELARVGGRPSSAGGLTPTEQRVAVLVAEGRRNRDVAKALFVSESAVEATLSRIYTKLGVRSRTELAARLRRTPTS